ncbi:MAG: SemiSWEET transporter [Rickettsiales bacterium]|nr:SemiSWEET transporter [Rickettsiales bacterium]
MIELVVYGLKDKAQLVVTQAFYSGISMNPEWVGILAGLLTTLAYIPQTIKVLRSKDTHSLSLGMYASITCGLALWLVYGLLVASPAIIISNAISLVMAAFILLMKLRHH